jgi:hypothetical protein
MTLVQVNRHCFIFNQTGGGVTLDSAWSDYQIVSALVPEMKKMHAPTGDEDGGLDLVFFR